MAVDARPTLADPDDDPYLWLEEIDGDRALAWVEKQNRLTLARFADAGFAADRDTLTEILDRPDNIPYVARRGPWLYNFWRDADNPRGLWRRTSLPEYEKPISDWQIVLDLDVLAEQEKTDWIWDGVTTLPGSHDRAILRLSRGGSDAVVLREFDVEARTFVEIGFNLAEAKTMVAWLDRNSLLVSSALGEGMATTSGYARTVRLWQRGRDFDQAPVIFEVDQTSMVAWGGVARGRDGDRIWFVERPSFFEMVAWLGDRDGPKEKLDLPKDAAVLINQNWLAVKLRRNWTVGGRDFAADSLLGISLSAFLAGGREFHILFEPQDRKAIQSFSWCNEQLILSILDNLMPVYEILTPRDGPWERSPITGLPDIGIATVWRMDVEESESNGELFVNLQDPLTPATLLKTAIDGSQTLLKRQPAAFCAEGLEISRHEAVSTDGVAVPYVQIGPANEFNPEKIGNAPVHLFGYGGFGASVLPAYRPAIGKLWLERGGTSVIANLRGGGEFGTPWHDAGRHAGKTLSHDDFASVAADLVRRGVTRPERIAAEGGSNGGILITNMLTRYPERFGALFCTIPLVDMRRYTKLLAGASWMDEYGDPDKSEDWAYLQNYSGYHLAIPGADYPAILLATSRRDDRVHPGHARKMAAKLQAMGYDANFYEPDAGGHGYGKDNGEVATFVALGYAFLRRAIGWADD